MLSTQQFKIRKEAKGIMSITKLRYYVDTYRAQPDFFFFIDKLNLHQVDLEPTTSPFLHIL